MFEQSTWTFQGKDSGSQLYLDGASFKVIKSEDNYLKRGNEQHKHPIILCYRHKRSIWTMRGLQKRVH